MNIGSGSGYPSSSLSNFAPHPFVFDGVLCNSMEGLLQSFKFDKPHIQEEVCKLVGKAAKFRGKKRNKQWKQTQTLYWAGDAYERGSVRYQELLGRAYDALATNSKFIEALRATRDCTLCHTLGSSDRKQTVLTEVEFINQLYRLRRAIL